MDHLKYKKYRFNEEKNLKLLEDQDRSIGFPQIIDQIVAGNVLKMIKHYNQEKYPNQYIMYVHIEDKVYAVPCVREGDDGYFLKTIYPSNKASDKFL